MNDAKMSDKQKTRQIIELLKHRHQPPEWAIFVELNLRTGFNSQRCDFFAFDMWPSKNFWRIAYEIKVSRSDFSKELSDPSKRQVSEELANECFFATPASLLRIDEIPEGWGLVEVTKGGLRKKKHAKQRTENDSVPIDFVAAVSRRISDPPSEIPDKLWKFADRKLSSDEVIKVAESLLEVNESTIRADERTKVFDTEEYKEKQELFHLITSNLGYEYRDPVKLKEWFEQKHDGLISRDLKWSLARAKTALDNLMEDLNGSADGN